jgi:hypothetical protein
MIRYDTNREKRTEENRTEQKRREVKSGMIDVSVKEEKRRKEWYD